MAAKREQEHQDRNTHDRVRTHISLFIHYVFSMAVDLLELRRH
jgi:hypothetical protein